MNRSELNLLTVHYHCLYLYERLPKITYYDLPNYLPKCIFNIINIINLFLIYPDLEVEF